MYALKRIFIYILIILFILSIYQDFTIGLETEDQPETENRELGYRINPVKVKPGDTVISIVESLNGNKLDGLEIDRIMRDFAEMNPSADPYHLKPATVYYFPLYENEGI